ITGVLEALGLRRAAQPREADIMLLNTCSIREKAAQKIFTRLGQLKRFKVNRPHMVIGVCGCVAQQEQERIFARAPFVDLVLGPRKIPSLPDLIRQSRARQHALGVFDPRDRLVPEVENVRRVSRTRAYITVMEGCDKSCSFCIVPLTRGREACRAPDAILREVAGCVQGGLPEIELLGQNVNAWRYRGEGGWNFSRLLGEVARVPGVRRLRFTTSHPLHLRDEIIEVMGSHETICRFLHLPAQSGSDRILKSMRRGYTRSRYLDRIRRLRGRMPDIALSTDIIVGFPGETDDDFAATLDLLREVRFDSVYSFIYSPRPGTPAAEMDDRVPPEEKKERLRRLQSIQDEIQLERNVRWVGRVVEVLVDGPSARGAGQLQGRISQHVPVNFDGEPSLVGRFARVLVESAGRHSLRGRLHPDETALDLSLSTEYNSNRDSSASAFPGSPGGGKPSSRHGGL
ncbi:MAG: tRNA (N6-isopentenyl adenosine(37)-C2)-methylthiotransferase MiaB, partial [Acidobacteriota bacterium]